MGQGQEDRTNKMLEECVKEGKMDLVILQNLHLMSKYSNVLKMIWEKYHKLPLLTSDVSFLLNLLHYLL